jgi:Fe-S-cluster containining protein
MVLQAKELHQKLKFKCKQCGKCCDETIIQLAPYDIKNICNALKITTKEFHEKYSMFRPFDQIPRCYLRNRPKCPFKENKNCTIYLNRPLRCRLFPLGRVYENNEVFIVLPEEKCMGFNTGKKQKISEWLEGQSVFNLDKESADWNNFLIKLKDNPIIKKEGFKEMFKEVFYNFNDPNVSMKELYENFNQKILDSFVPSTS